MTSLGLNELRPTYRAKNYWAVLSSRTASLFLTFNMHMLNCFRQTRPISLLLMPWLLALPENSDGIDSARKLGPYLPSGKDFNYMCHFNVEDWCEMEIYISLKKIDEMIPGGWLWVWRTDKSRSPIRKPVFDAAPSGTIWRSRENGSRSRLEPQNFDDTMSIG